MDTDLNYRVEALVKICNDFNDEFYFEVDKISMFSSKLAVRKFEYE